jgi:hypothetical protein
VTVVAEVEGFPVKDTAIGPRTRAGPRSLGGYPDFAQLLSQIFDIAGDVRPSR